MAEYARDYTIDELVIATLSRQLKDGEVVAHGVASIIPYFACYLARLTHAPNMVHLSLVGADAEPSKIFPSTVNPRIAERSTYYVTLPEVFDLAQRGKIDVMFFRGGIQIDKEGDINLSLIGSYERPKVRFPGGAGTSVLCHTVKRILMWVTKHNKRSFVEKVDFITISGHLPEVKKRFDKLVTNLCILNFDKKSGSMKLFSLHPGLTKEDVINNTGFDLIIPEVVPETEPPTIEQVKLLREKLDPQGLRKIEFM